VEQTEVKKHSLYEQFKVYVLEKLNGLGHFSSFTMRVFGWMPRRPYRHYLLLEQMYFIGNKSIFIIILTAIFSGAVFCFQTYLGFRIINADSFIGPIVAVSMAKELAPILSGLVVAGRCGAAMAAQIGTMRVTEQVDALEVMGINSLQYLAAPRIIATSLSMPLLVVIFLLVSNIGSYSIGTIVLGIEKDMFYSRLSDIMYLTDVAEGLIKAFIFGIIISVIGTYHGYNVSGGAEGVGRGTNLAVVWGMIMVLISDFFLTSILTVVFS
jgi:phospholipid/cholesterol/gamma-HCH transport system permease protein